MAINDILSNLAHSGASTTPCLQEGGGPIKGWGGRWFPQEEVLKSPPARKWSTLRCSLWQHTIRRAVCAKIYCLFVETALISLGAKLYWLANKNIALKLFLQWTKLPWFPCVAQNFSDLLIIIILPFCKDCLDFLAWRKTLLHDLLIKILPRKLFLQWTKLPWFPCVVQNSIVLLIKILPFCKNWLDFLENSIDLLIKISPWSYFCKGQDCLDFLAWCKTPLTCKFYRIMTFLSFF